MLRLCHSYGHLPHGHNRLWGSMEEWASLDAGLLRDDWRICERLSCRLIDSDFELLNVAGALFSPQSHRRFCKRIERQTATYFLRFAWRNCLTIFIAHNSFFQFDTFPCENFPPFDIVLVVGHHSDSGSLRSELQVLYSDQDLEGDRRKWDFLVFLKDMCKASALQNVLISGNIWSYNCRGRKELLLFKVAQVLHA